MEINQNYKKLLDDDFHAFLFVGSGETAKVLSEYLIAKHEIASADIVEMVEGDGEKTQIKAESAKDFVKKMYQSPFGLAKIGIIRGAERLNNSAGNVLLKLIEEPPKNSYLFLSSSTADMLPTIVSRCRVLTENQEIGAGDDLIGIFRLGFFESSNKLDEIVKEERSGELLLQVARHLEKKMLSSKDKKDASALEIVLDAYKKLTTNINQRLLLENVYFKTRDLI